MASTNTNSQAQVTAYPTGWPYIMAPVDELTSIRKVLDEHRVRYWMDEMSISVNGQPFVSVINFPRHANAEEIQALLNAHR
jgi:hypothetical protein